MRRRVAGATLIETLVALLLGLGVVQAGLTTLGRVRLAHGHAMERADALSAVRLTGALMRAETAVGRPGVDWVVDGDALALRAYRGTGLVCGEHEAPGALVVSYAGYRRPDPTKDSVLVVYADGAGLVVGLERVASGPPTCQAAPLEGSLELGLGRPVPPGGVLARVFERGSYFLADGALRYRRGAGGRQPLTPELLDRASGWRPMDGRLAAELAWRPRGGLQPGGGTGHPLRWRMPIGVTAP